MKETADIFSRLIIVPGDLSVLRHKNGAIPEDIDLDFFSFSFVCFVFRSLEYQYFFFFFFAHMK